MSNTDRRGGLATVHALGPDAAEEDIMAHENQKPNIWQKRQSAAAKLRLILNDPETICVCPGVYDGLTARLALKEGFDCLYMTGAGTSISRLGMADLGLAGLTDMKSNAEMIANLDPSVPLIADADTGYGGPIMVGRTVQQYVQAGVAALHLEDQVVQKRCGHLSGKELVSEHEYRARIRAAVEMRARIGSDIVIIARTDALATHGLDVAITRMKQALSIGADVVFIEAIETLEQARTICDTFKGTPVLYGMVQGSKSPQMKVAEAKEIGFKIIIYAGLCLAPVYHSVSLTMRALKKSGDPDKLPEGVNPHALFSACGMDELLAFDTEMSGTKS